MKINKKQIALGSVVLLTLMGCYSPQNTTANQARTRESFNKGWSFARFGPMPDKSKKEEPKGLEAVGYNDAAWRKLDLPHDWGIEGPFRQDLPGNTAKLPWKGIGWYRKTFIIPKADAGKRIFIDFDGAMANSKVYLNGKYVGGWPYGYTSFRLELTPFIAFGAKNTIAVRLDTVHWGSRWYPGAGIYRNVWLVKTAPVHVAHWGTYVTTPKITKDQATVKNVVRIDNQTKAKVSATVQTTFFERSADDKVGVEVAQTAPKTLSIDPEKTGDVSLVATIKNPKLWGLKNPNRYLARTTVSVNGKVTDQYDTSFGVRTIKFTAKNGFYLNGKRVQLQGVCNHHDLGPLGAAMNTSALRRQIQILQEMGCNAIRTSHNPPAPELLDLADKMGMLIMDETFDCWFKGKRKNDYGKLFDEWHVRDLTALALRDRNHPSVILWSTGNEIPSRSSSRGLKVSQELTDLFHKLDPTRPVTNGADTPQVHMKNGFQKTVDIFGFNYKPRYFYLFHKVPGNENKPYFGAETASTVSSRGVYFFPVNTKYRADFQIPSYDIQAMGWGSTAEQVFFGLDKHPECLGEFVWTGFDYLGEPSPYNKDRTNLLNFTDPVKKAKLKKELEALGKLKVPSRSSYFGIVDLCGFKKDRFYLYQSRWHSDLPMVHILPHWNWENRVGEVTPVHIYTSGDEAELFLNGKSLGRKKKALLKDKPPSNTGKRPKNIQDLYRLVWDDVKYQPGTLKVVAYKNGKEWATAEMKTTGKPTQLDLTTPKANISFSKNELAFITVSVKDSNGRIVPKTHNQVDFNVTGPGKIVAIGNGDATSHESFQAPTHKVFNGLALVYLQPTGRGKITLTATSKGLKNKEIIIEAN